MCTGFLLDAVYGQWIVLAELDIIEKLIFDRCLHD